MAMPTPAEMAEQIAHKNDSRVPDMLVAFVISLVLTHAAVALRFLARRVKQQPFKWDDWTILGSVAVTSAYIGLMIWLTSIGYGHHAITVKDPAPLAIGLLISEVLYSISICLIKTSTLFLLHRVFPNPKLTPYLWALGVLIHAYSMVLGICVMTQCAPLPALWVPELAMHAKCIPISTVFIVTSAMNALTDLILLAIPMPFLWQLNMSWQKKAQLSAIFVCGGMVFAISIARAPMLVNVSPVDPSWSDVNGGIWSAIESGVGTLCACLPTFGVLFTAARDRSWKSNYQYRIGDSESAQNLSGHANEHSVFSAPGKEVTLTVREERAQKMGDLDVESFALGEIGTTSKAEGVGVPARPTSRTWYRG